MNAYDFDKTIFYPDSSFTFVKWLWRKYPLYGFISAIIGFFFLILYKLRLISKTALKEKAFFIIKFVGDIDGEVELFWNENRQKLCRWYLDSKTDDDLIISASPEFLIKPMTDYLGVRLIATPMDRKTSKIHGENCYGEEKPRRFYEEYPDGEVENFYSDSLSDAPMAKIARKAFLVVDKGQRLIPWPEEK